MKELRPTLQEFLSKIKSGSQVQLFQKESEWHWKEVPAWDLFFKQVKEEKLVKNFIEILDEIEKIPIQFSTPPLQSIPFLEYLEAAELISERYSQQDQDQTLNFHFKRRIFALKYRLEASNGGLDPLPIQQDLFYDLVPLAQKWKERHPLFEDKSLNHLDKEKLLETSCYPEFAEQLLLDSHLENAFFCWILRDRNKVAPFILFPASQELIVDSALNGRIGRIEEGSLLKVKKVSLGGSILKKILTLPFEGIDRSILDPTLQITFRGNYRLTIEEIFKVFKNKYVEIGNLEFFKEGITNWNCHLWAWWNADAQHYQMMELEGDWWDQLPVLEVLTLEEAQKEYGEHLDGWIWNAAAVASRGTPTLNFEETHAYLEVAIPRGDGSYRIYDFGKFATQFPTNSYESLKIFCLNLHATVAYPDENIFYSHREHANHSFPLHPSEGRLLMQRIKQDLLRGREKNFIYQIESENCAKWLQEHLEFILGKSNVPNLYRIPLLGTEPVGFMKILFNCIRALPEFLQVSALTALHIPFGAWTKTWIQENGQWVAKSLDEHEFWQTAEVYLPALLHHQKKQGALQPVSRRVKVRREFSPSRHIVHAAA